MVFLDCFNRRHREECSIRNGIGGALIIRALRDIGAKPLQTLAPRGWQRRPCDWLLHGSSRSSILWDRSAGSCRDIRWPSAFISILTKQ